MHNCILWTARAQLTEQALQEEASFFRPLNPKRLLRFGWGDYLALSYTWGDANQRRNITVNGATISVTANLEAALRSIRDSRVLKAGVKLWVDALCINQDDLEERNRQVKRMQSIFSNAQSVFVWLGEAAGKSILEQRIPISSTTRKRQAPMRFPRTTCRPQGSILKHFMLYN